MERRDGPSMAKRLVIIAVTDTEEDDNNEALIYVKEFKRKNVNG